MPNSSTTPRRTRRPSGPVEMYRVAFPSGYVTDIPSTSQAGALAAADKRRVADEGRAQRAGAVITKLEMS